MGFPKAAIEAVKGMRIPGYQVPVLVYHSFSKDTVGGLPFGQFSRELALLGGWGCRVVPLAEAIGLSAGGEAAREWCAALTFDDGYADFFTQALPLLRAKGLPVTVFVTTDFIGTPGYMTWQQLREASRDPLVTVGSHTVSHTDLTKASAEALRRELADSRSILEQALSRPVDLLAYPWGQFSEAVAEAARGYGYRAACTTNSRLAAGRKVPAHFAVKRMTAVAGDGRGKFLAKVSGVGTCTAKTIRR
jgi:poly-beta-1,6-N-acetyl-D-glucosamine N-deacetylase